jgi:hypothetical protein
VRRSDKPLIVCNSLRVLEMESNRDSSRRLTARVPSWIDDSRKVSRAVGFISYNRIWDRVAGLEMPVSELEGFIVWIFGIYCQHIARWEGFKY